MAAKHAVLGLLIEDGPDYGYKLAQRLERRCEPWRWTEQVAYTGLRTLAKEGLVHVLGEESLAGSTRAEQRTLYEATQPGVTFFQGWLGAMAPMEAPRHELELKIVMAQPHELSRLIDITWAQEQMCIDRLQALGGEADLVARGGRLTWREIGAKLVRDIEISQLQDRVKWLQQARSTMKLFLDRTAGGPAPRGR